MVLNFQSYKWTGLGGWVGGMLNAGLLRALLCSANKISSILWRTKGDDCWRLCAEDIFWSELNKHLSISSFPNQSSRVTAFIKCWQPHLYTLLYHWNLNTLLYHWNCINEQIFCVFASWFHKKNICQKEMVCLKWICKMWQSRDLKWRKFGDVSQRRPPVS